MRAWMVHFWDIHGKDIFVSQLFEILVSEGFVQSEAYC